MTTNNNIKFFFDIPKDKKLSRIYTRGRKNHEIVHCLNINFAYSTIINSWYGYLFIISSIWLGSDQT